MAARKASIPSPLDSVLPYGRKWIDDEARFKVGMWARQTGKSHYGTLEAVRDCRERKTMWVILSAGERQALEAMLKARDHDQAFRVALAGYEETRDGSETLLKAAEMRWPNGSRLIGIPANPDTARGYSANLLLDEFAFHEKPDEIWRAIYPSISNPLRGQYKIRIVSTPNGLSNKFADIWLRGGDQWSRHKLTIHDAVAQGLPLNIEELRAGLNDPEGWAQEFECEFIDSSAVLLPYDLIAKCESPDATTAQPAEYLEARGGPPRYLGIDFGRKKDLTVAWTVERRGDVLHTTEVLELRGLDTPAQVEALQPRIHRAQRVCLDFTGPGVGLGDYLVKSFGEWNPEAHRFGRIELVTFTNAKKVELFSKLRIAFDEVKLRVPISRAIREDLHSVQRVTTPTGQVTYRAPHTDDGHADRCTALALGLKAGANPFAGAILEASLIHVGGHAAAMPQFRPRTRRSLLGRLKSTAATQKRAQAAAMRCSEPSGARSAVEEPA